MPECVHEQTEKGGKRLCDHEVGAPSQSWPGEEAGETAGACKPLHFLSLDSDAGDPLGR